MGSERLSGLPQVTQLEESGLGLDAYSGPIFFLSSIAALVV